MLNRCAGVTVLNIKFHRSTYPLHATAIEFPSQLKWIYHMKSIHIPRIALPKKQLSLRSRTDRILLRPIVLERISYSVYLPLTVISTCVSPLLGIIAILTTLKLHRYRERTAGSGSRLKIFWQERVSGARQSST